MINQKYVSDLDYEVNKHPLYNLGAFKRALKKFFRIERKKRLCTILFVDMADSALLKWDDDDVWQENIFYLHEKTKKIVKLCNGKISKTIGDCVMCYFTGERQSDNSLRCTFALLEHFTMMKFDFKLNMWDSSLYGFNVKIGLAVGVVSFLYKHDMYGPPVDLASRLQNLANEGEACIHSDVFDFIKEKDLLLALSGSLSDDEFPEIKSFDGIKIRRMQAPYDFWNDKGLIERCFLFARNKLIPITNLNKEEDRT